MSVRKQQPLPPHESVWRDAAWQTSVRRGLTTWFDVNQRELPWRQTADPYKIWVSEIMLQQTQVATVIDYFNRFCARFPDVADLATADIEDVLRLWEGLGYYRRARQLHAAARKIVERYGGRFPSSFEQVLDLPGIGRYTAGAILSISQDQKYPVVEANTVRLYSRLIALRQPPAETAAKRLLWEVAEALLPSKRSGRFNQAAMELGALVCTPRSPGCDNCPLAANCQAKRLGIQEAIPGQVKKLVYEDRRHVALVVQQAGSCFMRVCQPGSHWEGLWDFPRFDVTACEPHDGSGELDYVRQCFEQEFGWQIEVGEELTKLRHGVTKFRITLRAYRATKVGQAVVRECGSDEAAQSGWFTPSQIAQLPLNTTGRKLSKLLNDASCLGVEL